MEHLGIDLGASRSAVCRVSNAGSIIKEREVRTAELGDLLARLGSSRVAIESCAESRAVAKIAQGLGHEVRPHCHAVLASTPPPRLLRNFRTAIEGTISFLKRGFGMRRVLWRGLQSFKSYVWGSVVSANLLLFARYRLADA